MYCKELHLDNFKGDFLNICIFMHPHIQDIQIVIFQPNVITNHTSMKSLFFQLSDDVYISNLKKLTGFGVQGHKCIL